MYGSPSSNSTYQVWSKYCLKVWTDLLTNGSDGTDRHTSMLD